MNVIRGEIRAVIGGAERTLKFGTNATAHFCELYGVGLGQIGAMFAPESLTPAHFRDLIWCALVSGARVSGQPFTHSREEVGDWLDELTPDELAGVFSVIQASAPQGEAGGKPTG